MILIHFFYLISLHFVCASVPNDSCPTLPVNTSMAVGTYWLDSFDLLNFMLIHFMCLYCILFVRACPTIRAPPSLSTPPWLWVRSDVIILIELIAFYSISFALIVFIRAGMRIYRALLRMCRALLQICRAFLRIHMALSTDLCPRFLSTSSWLQLYNDICFWNLFCVCIQCVRAWPMICASPPFFKTLMAVSAYWLETELFLVGCEHSRWFVPHPL